MPGRPAGIFRFKQFTVDQSGCAMKINTDGVLLGALAEASNPAAILDIGTGTGVIALMLAQRFENAFIDAVEIDNSAAATATRNFEASPFGGRMKMQASGFEDFFNEHPEPKYDLIVSNPPFFLNSLESPGAKKNLARHTDAGFFERLITGISGNLSKEGICTLILPLPTARLVKGLLPASNLYLQKVISIRSFIGDEPHREIITFGLSNHKPIKEDFVIYDGPKVYSQAYKDKMRDFFTIFN